MKILVLCHGNKYRSPMCAALLARSKALDVRSRGFRDDNAPAAKHVREYAMSRFGIDLSEHRSVKVTPDDLKWADRIVFMDNGNRTRLESLIQRTGIEKPRYCLGTFAVPHADRIPDPAFTEQGGAEFLRIMKMLCDASERFATHLLTLAK